MPQRRRSAVTADALFFNICRSICAVIGDIRRRLELRAIPVSRLRLLLSAVRHPRAARSVISLSEASRRARCRLRHSMLGEPGVDEAVRLFGIGR
jgi:hypothetical protein